MSYCVNCGVELADSEKHCPLCQTEVINPRAPWQEPAERPYSRHVDTMMRRIDRRYFAALTALLLSIPCIITVLLDILTGGGLTWSAYVIGAVAVTYVVVLLPFFFKKYHVVIFLGADCAAILLYLLFIETVNGGSWFMELGLPLTVSASVCMLALALLFTKRRLSIIVKTGAVLIAVGVFVVAAEVFISLDAYRAVRIVWSFYALIPCVVLGAAALVLEHRQNFKERVRRRLFY
jgi:hypothetical protein